MHVAVLVRVAVRGIVRGNVRVMRLGRMRLSAAAYHEGERGAEEDCRKS
ncbi:hypothetical protein [Polyangium aurulentum]|nr:hypothetical protein [Polyangium aurulentum]UQA60298.1 hypothetical protein E8A73_007425 [Polyangium aurulentum]